MKRWIVGALAGTALFAGGSVAAQDATGYGGAAGFLAAHGRIAAPGVPGTPPARNIAAGALMRPAPRPPRGRVPPVRRRAGPQR